MVVSSIPGGEKNTGLLGFVSLIENARGEVAVESDKLVSSHKNLERAPQEEEGRAKKFKNPREKIRFHDKKHAVRRREEAAWWFKRNKRFARLN